MLKQQLQQIATAFLAGVQGLVRHPGQIIIFVILLFVMMDVIKGVADGGTVMQLIGWFDSFLAVLKKNISMEVVAIVAIAALSLSGRSQK